MVESYETSDLAYKAAQDYYDDLGVKLTKDREHSTDQYFILRCRPVGKTSKTSEKCTFTVKLESISQDKWVIVTDNNSHNHPLPQKAVHRLDEPERDLVRTLIIAGAETHTIMNVLALRGNTLISISEVSEIRNSLLHDFSRQQPKFTQDPSNVDGMKQVIRAVLDTDDKEKIRPLAALATNIVAIDLHMKQSVSEIAKPKRAPDTLDPSQKKQRKEPVCSVCMRTGHNSRACYTFNE